MVPVADRRRTCSSWTGWILSRRRHRRLLPQLGRDRRQGRHAGPWLLPDWLRSLWHYEHEVYEFHVGLHTPHTYQSNPWSWLVLGRPVSYFYESPAPGKDGCPADAGQSCAREVLALGTPLLWWAACFALAVRAVPLGASAATGGRARSPAAIAARLSALVPVPGAHDLLLLRGRLRAVPVPGGGDDDRRDARPAGRRANAAGSRGAAGAGVLVLLIAWNFIYFWPIYTGTPIPIDAWRSRMWLDTWV